MAIARVFIADLGLVKVDSSLELPKAASHHIVRVSRHKVGDHIILFDDSPQDVQYLCSIEVADKNKLLVKVLQKQEAVTKSATPIHIYPAVTRGSNFDWLLQKSVELGVSSINPVLTQYTQISFDSKKMAAKVESWQKLVISACEQCGLNIVPKVNYPIKLKELLLSDDFSSSDSDSNSESNSESESDLCLIGLGPLELQRACDKSIIKNKGASNINILEVKDLINREYTKEYYRVNLLTGPEGGFSNSEIMQVCESSLNFLVICCGKRVLRMETAPIVLLTLLQAGFGGL